MAANEIGCIELSMRELGKRWKLKVYEQNREKLKRHYGVETFLIAFLLPTLSDGQTIQHLVLSNTKNGQIITLEIFDQNVISISGIRKLESDVLISLLDDCNIKMAKVIERPLQRPGTST